MDRNIAPKAAPQRISGIADLARRGVTFQKRDFNTDNADLYAYDYSFLVPTGVAGLAGTTPTFNYFNAIPPMDFNYHVQPPRLPTDAPSGTMNPLLNPQWAASFYANAQGPDRSAIMGMALGG